ncbi:MAG: SprT family zinc-dependent metalloprotease [Pseudomonadota bacterium]
MILRRRRLPEAKPATLRLHRPDAEVALNWSSRATRFTLSVGRADGKARLTLPSRADLSEAQAFLNRQAGWLEAAMARSPAPQPLRVGDALPFRGHQVVLMTEAGPRRAPRVEGGRLIVRGDDAAAAAKALAFLKAEARAALVPAAERHAATLGRRPARITLRDTRSRWGSCSSAGALSFSWRLIMAPPEVLDYVAAHEAAHLVEMNHSPRFWALVERLDPEWRTRRDWLRAHGARLQRVTFKA